MTWEHFLEMLHAIYVSLVKKERLAHEYLDLIQMTESATKITNMFTERALFSPEFATLEETVMTRYLGMLKTYIR